VLKKIFIRTTRREEARDITNEIQRVVAESGVEEGFSVIYVARDAAALSTHRTLAEADAPRLDRTCLAPRHRGRRGTAPRSCTPEPFLTTKARRIALRTRRNLVRSTPRAWRLCSSSCPW